MKKNIERINEMEKILNKQEKFVKEMEEILKKYEMNFKDFVKLRTYYYSDEYEEDLKLDEEGKLDDIDRGVLSEDSIYDLMSDYFSTGLRMIELGTDTLKED